MTCPVGSRASSLLMASAMSGRSSFSARSVFGHEARGVVPAKSQAQQLPAVAVDRKPPKQVSGTVQREQRVGISDLASALPFGCPLDKFVEIRVPQAPDLS